MLSHFLTDDILCTMLDNRRIMIAISNNKPFWGFSRIIRFGVSWWKKCFFQNICLYTCLCVALQRKILICFPQKIYQQSQKKCIWTNRSTSGLCSSWTLLYYLRKKRYHKKGNKTDSTEILWKHLWPQPYLTYYFSISYWLFWIRVLSLHSSTVQLAI